MVSLEMGDRKCLNKPNIERLGKPPPLLYAHKTKAKSKITSKHFGKTQLYSAQKMFQLIPTHSLPAIAIEFSEENFLPPDACLWG